jgi:hypothetical protein
MKDTVKLPKGGHYFVKAAERPVKTVQAATKRRDRSSSRVRNTTDPALVRELRKHFQG